MHTANEQLIKSFYEAFSKKDAEGMVKFYADTSHFSDPVFPNLSGEAAKNMWRMLCKNSKDLRVVVSDVFADANTGRAKWDAWYTFSGTGRKVHNVVQAQFEFHDGKIVKHRDRFSFWRWSCQALGTIGLLLGWTPFLLTKVRSTAQKSLASFESRSPAS